MSNNIKTDELLKKIAKGLGRKVVEITDDNYLNPNISWVRIIDTKKYISDS